MLLLLIILPFRSTGMFSGVGAGSGPYIAIHEGFQGVRFSCYHQTATDTNIVASRRSGKGAVIFRHLDCYLESYLVLSASSQALIVLLWINIP